MQEQFKLETLARRLARYVERHPVLRPEAARILEEVLLRGEMPRGDAERASGLRERAARMVLGSLIEEGLLGSATPKARYRYASRACRR